MPADGGGVFISQREFSRMALARPSIEPDYLRETAPGMPAPEAPLDASDEERTLARVWRGVATVLPIGPDADRRFSRFLETTCKLVYLPGDSISPVDPD